jgi:hypothetical protein
VRVRLFQYSSVIYHLYKKYSLHLNPFLGSNSLKSHTANI